MKELIEAISFEQALIITAPPGWGKTYKILESLKYVKRKVFFVFPLRALCDEVYISALKKGLSVANLKSQKDAFELNLGFTDLVLTTPECLLSLDFTTLDSEILFILDECHLYYYWGESFRPSMEDFYFNITSHGNPLILLSATLEKQRILNFEKNLRYNYRSVHHIDFGNQKLKNTPSTVYYYPSFLRDWMRLDYLFSSKRGVSLIFCAYRSQVKDLVSELKNMGYKVLGCVGGEASEFILKLNEQKGPLDFIVATTVVSHGVNLPSIEKIYFLYKVKNIDYYLQMVGRGGRAGEEFEIHTYNQFYFSYLKLFRDFMGMSLKRIRNRLNSYLYYYYAS